MDLLDRVGQKDANKNSPDRMGLFQPQRRKAKTLLLAWLSASLIIVTYTLHPFRLKLGLAEDAHVIGRPR